jgi:hypothetical protein
MSRRTSDSEPEWLDPAVRHARREAVVVLIAFAVCLVWSVGWCYLWGYDEPAEGQVAKVLGMPSWVFWGVLVPWLAADVFGVWFCFFYLADDPLGEAEDERRPGGGAAGTGEEGREDRHD